MPAARSTPRTTSATTPAQPAAGRRRSHAERSAQTRAQLLGAAAGLVRDGGVQAASMFEVAKAAGVTPGALQHHFGSKAELMMQLIEHVLRNDDGAGVAWPEPSLALPRRCRAFVDTLWATVYEPPRFLTAWSVYFGSQGDGALMARIGQRRQQVNAELQQRLLAVFPELRQRLSAVEAAGLADLLFAALRGLALSRLFDAGGPPGPDPAAAARRELARLIETRCTAAIPADPATPRTRTHVRRA